MVFRMDRVELLKTVQKARPLINAKITELKRENVRSISYLEKNTEYSHLVKITTLLKKVFKFRKLVDVYIMNEDEAKLYLDAVKFLRKQN